MNATDSAVWGLLQAESPLTRPQVAARLQIHEETCKSAFKRLEKSGRLRECGLIATRWGPARLYEPIETIPVLAKPFCGWTPPPPEVQQRAQRWRQAHERVTWALAAWGRWVAQGFPRLTPTLETPVLTAAVALDWLTPIEADSLYHVHVDREWPHATPVREVYEQALDRIEDAIIGTVLQG